MDKDLLTGIYLRHSAFLVRRYPEQPSSAVFHFATLGVTVLVAAWLLAILALAFLVASQILGKPIAPWSAPIWLIAVASVALVFLPGIYVDRKFRSCSVDTSLLENYNAPRERLLWWLLVLSLVLSAGIVAACFGAIRLSS